MTLPSILIEGATPLASSKGLAAQAETMSEAATAPKSLGIEVPLQEQDQWCWAAVAAGLAKCFSSSSIPQCLIVTRVKGVQACPAGSNPEADHWWYLEPALELIRAYKETLGGSRDFQFVREHIDAELPVVCRIQWPDGTGHFVVIDGYSIAGGSDVEVHDSFFGPSTIPIDEFATRYQQRGFWERTFETTRPPRDRTRAVRSR